MSLHQNTVEVLDGGACGAGFPGELWSLREDVLLETGVAGEPLTLVSRWGEIAIRHPGPLLREALGRMQLGPVSLENVLDGGPGRRRETLVERARLLVALGRLQHLVVRSVAAEDGENVLLSVKPIAYEAEFRPRPVDPDRPLRLSTYAALAAEGGTFTACSPLSLHKVLLHRPEAGALITLLARPQSAADVVRAARLPPRLAFTVLSYLLEAGIAVPGEDGVDGPFFAEDSDLALRLWPPEDLMFHSRSTLGRQDREFGATYPSAGRLRPLPAVAPRPERDRIALYRPQLADLLATDPPFTAVLEARRSVRRLSVPPTVRELGELLYRALRIRALLGPAGAEPLEGDLIDRPYPAGGAIHELEFYITVGDCTGLEPGVYAYEALRHELVPVNRERAAREELLDRARCAATLDAPPPVLITVTARFGRVHWKYSGLGYALILKHAGVVLQTLYLVTTAMRLAGCAIGTSEIEESSRAFGVDWRAESAVAAFVLGREPDEPRPAEPAAVHPANDPQWREECERMLAERSSQVNE